MEGFDPKTTCGSTRRPNCVFCRENDSIQVYILAEWTCMGGIDPH